MNKLLIAVLMLVAAPFAWADPGNVHSLRGDAPLNAESKKVMATGWREGEGKITRNYPQQPPLIPHSIEDYSITKGNNDCLMCHNWNSELPGATKVGVSHFVSRDGQALSTISPRRYFCIQCHVPQRDVKPLVMNTN